MYNLKEELNKRDNFKMAIDYSKRKGFAFVSMDTMEKYYIDKDSSSFEHLEEKPDDKEWTTEGTTSVDINVHYYPNLFTLDGIKTLFLAIYSWIKDIIEEPSLFKYSFSSNPFFEWVNWLFVFDSWDAVRYEIIDNDKNIRRYSKEYQDKVQKISKEEIINYLDNSELYEKVGDKFYSQKNDPTCIVCLEEHDLKDGYSHKKIVSLLNEWIKIGYGEEVKFVLSKD